MSGKKSSFMDRTPGRRAEDHAIRESLTRLRAVFHVGQSITSEMNLEDLFQLIITQTNQIMETERCTIFLFDPQKNELWSYIATGLESNEIRLPSDCGIAGNVFTKRTPLIINDTVEDNRFYSVVDGKTGFCTRNILCVPLIKRNNECMGALQVLNKIGSDFSESDSEMLSSIATYVAIALENAQLYKSVNETSERLRSALIHIEKLETVKRQLTKFVPSSIRSMVEENPEMIDLGKKPAKATILFMDIQGFSKITESYEQSKVNNLIETYFSAYLNCILSNFGEINEISGDGLMVIFKEGTEAEHAMSAIKAGIGIIGATESLNRKNQYPWGDIRLHLGINTGTVWLGCTRMKSITGEHYTYTASGLVTVIAARIGELSSDNDLLIGLDTFLCAKDLIDAEPMGQKALKHVRNSIPIYRVKGVLEKD
jgi:class 3 adenylate cyclase/putative methionine-R-sulfoxide reductase with GAF domain